VIGNLDYVQEMFVKSSDRRQVDALFFCVLGGSPSVLQKRELKRTNAVLFLSSSLDSSLSA